MTALDSLDDILLASLKKAGFTTFSLAGMAAHK
jgi:hypothetical protein